MKNWRQLVSMVHKYVNKHKNLLFIQASKQDKKA